MGIFNFKKKGKGPEHQLETDSSEKYYGDLEKTALLTELFNTPEASRNETWKQRFLEHVAEASFACGDPQIIQGPDGFPYFQLQTPEANKPFQCYVVKQIIPDFILDQGIGVVINAQKGQPDWVFTYGNLVNYYSRGAFYTQAPDIKLPAQEVLKEEEKVLVGPPSEEFFPQQVRNTIRQFLTQQGIQDTKIALMSRQYGTEVLQELVINLTPEKIGGELYETLAPHLKWFLPNHYAMVAMDENGPLKEDFEPL